MQQPLPAYLRERLQRPYPVAGMVVAGSTPVLAFGAMRQATVATIGLNPSKNEFLNRHGHLLAGTEQRLVTLASLGLATLADADASQLQAVYAGCVGYFQRNPYRRWFDQLEAIVQGCGASYYAGSACHLDLVQWATDPIWRNLAPATRASLIAADRDFLAQQLQHEQIRLGLINGRGVMNALAEAYGLQFVPAAAPVSDRSVTTQFFESMAFGNVRLIAWTTNLQSSVGVTNTLRAAIRQRVAELVGSFEENAR
ncbi:hypothetical protein [Herpetosiphon sp. NSE202]|uniref:hypothetical protein n=1 Tax=Herpetosiphon sp. NSE202 TaxID=3351349 RepID=UPI003628ED30